MCRARTEPGSSSLSGLWAMPREPSGGHALRARAQAGPASTPAPRSLARKVVLWRLCPQACLDAKHVAAQRGGNPQVLGGWGGGWVGGGLWSGQRASGLLHAKHAATAELEGSQAAAGEMIGARIIVLKRHMAPGARQPEGVGAGGGA